MSCPRIRDYWHKTDTHTHAHWCENQGKNERDYKEEKGIADFLRHTVTVRHFKNDIITHTHTHTQRNVCS